MNPKNFSINDFMPIAVLGSGSFGLVYLVESRVSKRKYAMKVLDKKKIVMENIVRYCFTKICIFKYLFIDILRQKEIFYQG